MEQAIGNIKISTKILSALQEIPGEKAHEKQKWLAKEIKKKVDDKVDLESLVGDEKIPKDLHPLIEIEAAKISIRLGNKDSKNFEKIKNGLLSENSELVTRALGLNEYFDSSNQALNCEHFIENLFPFVTYSTRCKIIKKLAKSLPSQQAEEFFEKILKIYGLKQAEPLLVACSSDFLRESVTKYRIVLSPNCVLKLFQKDSNLVFWYLKLSDPKLNNSKNRFNHKNDIRKYSSFLPKLIRRHLKEFLAIVELQGEDFYLLKLSQKQIKRFQRNAREEYLSKPKFFFKFLNQKKILEQDLEEMFPKMFPKLENFDVNSMLMNLKYYPREKTAKLFLDSYEKAYGRNLLDNEKVVTERLMKLLKKEDRLKLAKIKAEKQSAGQISRWETNWKCYLSVEEIVPNLRSELNKAPDVNKRISLIGEILLCCEVNDDLDELLDVLKLIRDRHRNEIPYFHQSFLRNLENLQKLLTKEHWDVIFEIIQRLWIKVDQSDFRSLPRELLVAGLKFKFDNDQPYGLIFEWLFYVISHDYWQQWSSSDEPKIQRLSIENFSRIAEQVGRKGGRGWDEMKERTMTSLIEEIYKYNERCLERNALSEILPTDGLSWHFDELFRILKEDNNLGYSSLKAVLKKYNKELHDKLWPSDTDLIEIDVQALNRLKKNPKDIASQWERYFEECLKQSHTKSVHLFIRKLAWYNDLPKKFLEKCLANVKDEENNEKGDSFILISLLIDGDSYSKLAEPFLPTKDIDVIDPEAGEQFSLIRKIVAGMKLVNPPVKLDFIERLCQGDYLSTALTALENSCKRTKLPTALDFSRNLAKQRVSVGKHGVRLMLKLSNFEESFNFLKNTWLEQEHYSIRSIVLAETQNLFTEFPNEKTWGLMKEMIESMKEKDEPMLAPWPFKVDLIPNEFVVDFMKILLHLVENLEALIPEKKERNLYGYSLLMNIDSALSNVLPEDFMEKLLKKYLFNESPKFINRAEEARSFLVNKYLETEKLEERLNVLTKIFKEQVKTDCLLVKTATRELILRIIFNKWETVDRTVIISHVLAMFSSILSFSDDPKSYLLLNFANEWVNSKDLPEFVNRIARKLPGFYEKLSPWFSYQLADSLRDFLSRNHFDLHQDREEIIKEVMMILLEHKEIEVVCTVAQMLSLVNRNEEEEYIPLFKKLRENEHPVVQSLVNNLLK